MLECTLTWIESKDFDKETMSSQYLAYDNMCHVANLRARKGEVVPGKEETLNLWDMIQKIIDGLHINNHQEGCQAIFSPDQMKADHPNFNTMAAEQVFSWASRLKNEF